jgi:hypothetical protein
MTDMYDRFDDSEDEVREFGFRESLFSSRPVYRVQSHAELYRLCLPMTALRNPTLVVSLLRYCNTCFTSIFRCHAVAVKRTVIKKIMADGERKTFFLVSFACLSPVNSCCPRPPFVWTAGFPFDPFTISVDSWLSCRSKFFQFIFTVLTSFLILFTSHVFVSTEVLRKISVEFT